MLLFNCSISWGLGSPLIHSFNINLLPTFMFGCNMKICSVQRSTAIEHVLRELVISCLCRNLHPFKDSLQVGRGIWHDKAYRGAESLGDGSQRLSARKEQCLGNETKGFCYITSYYFPPSYSKNKIWAL